MKTTLRWYGERRNPTPLKYIKQIPEVSGIMGTLSYKAAGVLWEEPKIKDLVDSVYAAGLEYGAIKSVNVYGDIKPGLSTYDRCIDAYNKALGNLAKYGVKVVVYNFMLVFDWLCINLAYETEDGSNCLCYGHKKVEGMSLRDIVELTAKEFGGLTLPRRESERPADLDRVMGLYQGVDHDATRTNYRYFLEGIIPTAEKTGIKMVCHPDDPAWDSFGLPRIYRNHDNTNKAAKLYDSDSHGFYIYAGSLGSNMDNDIPAIMREFEERGCLRAAHVRNVKYIEPKFSHKSPYSSSRGDLDTYAIVGAIYETSPNAYIHPDHRHMVQGETGRPDYPLYDRALGAIYLAGLREAVEKTYRGG